jgi:hypothetical protein
LLHVCVTSIAAICFIVMPAANNSPISTHSKTLTLKFKLHIQIDQSITVDAVQNANNSSGNFGFLTQMAHAFIQPAC